MTDSRTPLTVTFLLCGLLCVGPAAGMDFPEATLGGAVGATDYHKLNCPAGTDHLDFKATQTSPIDSAPQIQNLHVVKAGSGSAEASAIAPGKTGSASLAGGSGKYRITVNANGSAAPGKQAFSLAFQCLNAAGAPVKTSVAGKSGKLKKQPKNFVVACKGNGAERLQVYLSNTTRSGKPLIAQAVKDNAATSITDGMDFASIQGGEGDYYVTVGHTATGAGPDRAYVLQANCLDNAGASIGEPTLSQLQDN